MFQFIITNNGGENSLVAKCGYLELIITGGAVNHALIPWNEKLHFGKGPFWKNLWS